MEGTLVGIKATLVGVVAALALFLGGSSVLPGTAPEAAHAQTQDGLVNVVIQDSLNDVVEVIVQDVNVGVAVNAAITACDVVDIGPISLAILGRAASVDKSGRDFTVCRTEAGDVTIVQN